MTWSVEVLCQKVWLLNKKFWYWQIWISIITMRNTFSLMILTNMDFNTKNKKHFQPKFWTKSSVSWLPHILAPIWQIWFSILKIRNIFSLFWTDKIKCLMTIPHYCNNEKHLQPILKWQHLISCNYPMFWHTGNYLFDSTLTESIASE